MNRYLIVLILILSSCSVPNYVFQNDLQTTGVNFSTGRWLLNEVNAPAEVRSRITTLAQNDFGAVAQGRMHYAPETPGLLLPRQIGLQPDKGILSDLQQGTGFDYFINIKAEPTRSDYGTVDLTPHKLDRGGNNSAFVVVEIYDLNRGEIIYSQRVVGSVSRNDDNNDVHFGKSVNELMVNAYKKLFSDLKRKSMT